jgi:hypothetical protein
MFRLAQTLAKCSNQEPVGDSRSDALADEVMKFFNGNWSHDCLEHHCETEECCRGFDVQTSRKRAATILSTILVDNIGAQTVRMPSMSRWTSMAPVLRSMAPFVSYSRPGV